MKTVPFGDLARQAAFLRTGLESACSRVVGGGRYIFGDEVERFEASFAEWCGATDVIGVASGTDAITIALASVGVGPGDEVITVANTCIPTIVGIEATGAVPVLVDASAETRTLDPAAVAAAVTPRTRAIVPVHLYGRMADLDALTVIAEDHGLVLVEDCAQAHGAQSRGRRAGTIGAAGAFSFYPTKNLGALGDGGAVVTSDPDVAERARLLRNYGERARFEHVVRGRNSRLDALQAAFLTVKLPHVDAWTERRLAIAKRYSMALEGTTVVTPTVPGSGRHAFHLYVVEVSNRVGFRQALAAAGVETAVHYPRPVHLQPAYRELGSDRGFVVSERLARTVVSLPMYPELTDDEVDRVSTAVRAAGLEQPPIEIRDPKTVGIVRRRP